MASRSPQSRKHSPRTAVLQTRPEYERLGRWIRTHRESAGLSQRALSRRLGKSEQFLHKVEHGRQRIDLVEFLDLCLALQITDEELLGLRSGLGE